MNRFLTISAMWAIVLVAAVGSAQDPPATVIYWDDGYFPNHSYHTGENWWSPDVPELDNQVPRDIDSAYVQNGGTVEISQDLAIYNIRLSDEENTTGYATMTGGVVDISNALYVGHQTGGEGGFDMSGGTLNVSEKFYVAVYTNGVFNLTNGTINAGRYVRMGYTGGVAVFNQSGGSLIHNINSDKWMRIGYAKGSYANYNLSGGVLEAAGILLGNNGDDSGSIGVGVLNQTGGSITVRSNELNDPHFGIGTNGSAMGVYNLTGGTCRLVNGHLKVGTTGSYEPLGQINIGGTGHLTVDYQGVDGPGFVRLGYLPGADRKGTGVINLATGGALTAPAIRSGDDDETAGYGFLNFHGGTLVANVDNDDYLQYMDAHIYGEGATINTDGHNVAINRALLAPTDMGVQSIAVNGMGSGYDGPPALKISGGSGHGATAIATVSDGHVTGFTITNPGSGYQSSDVLTVDVVGGGPSGIATVGAITFGANTSGGLTKTGEGVLTLGGANTYTGATSVQAGGLAVTGSITSDVTVDATASLAGTGTIDGDVDLNGTFAVAYDSDADTVDALTVTGLLDLTGATISFSDVGAGSLAGGTYVIANYGSLIEDSVTVIGDQTGWTLDYAYEGNSIALTVPASQRIPGDANDSGTVDKTDAQILAAHWGETGADWSMGNFNGDDVVNVLDAAILAANWGAGVQPESSAVPEPSAFLALLFGLLGMAAAPHRRRRE